MALTYTPATDLTFKCPDFSLPVANSPTTTNSNREIHFSSFWKEQFLDKTTVSPKALLIVFWCNHCPYIVHIREAFSLFVEKNKSKGLITLAINSNDTEKYPEDSFEKMQEYSTKYHYPYLYLWDKTQEVAKSFGAVCTPDFFLFKEDLSLFYRGQFCSSRPGSTVSPSGESLQLAFNSLLEGQRLSAKVLPSCGCNIKWKTSIN